MPLKLNEEQKQIVHGPLKPALVVAAAGTGKTRVLTERIIYLMDNAGIKPTEILAITFTNMAAEEMKERIHRRLKDTSKIPNAIGTIHAVFSDILRRDIEKICPYRKHSFEILQEDGQNWAIKRAFQILKLPSFHHKTKLNYIKNLLSEGKTGKFLNTRILSDDQLEKYEPIFEEYENVLKSKNLLDFDDVLILTIKLLTEYEDVRNYWANKYKSILIDEVQDLNEIQGRLVKTLISDKTSNFLAVGDPNQCIYIFNRAKENIFDEIKQSFSDLIIYELTNNYRSCKSIVAFSNEIKHIKCCKAVSNKSEDGLVYHCKSINEAIDALRKCGDYKKGAILFPKHSNVKTIIELLIKHAIPFKTSRFYLLENVYIEKLILLFQAVFFDNSYPLETLLCCKEFMLSSHAKKEILNSENWPYQYTLSEFLLEGESGKNFHINSKDLSQIEYFVTNIKILKQLPKDNLASLVPHFKNFLFANTKLTASTLHKIDLFMDGINNIQEELPEGSSEDIVMNFRNYSEFSKTDITRKTNNSITLSTVHKAKGLEWDKVIILEYQFLEQESQLKTKDKHLAYVAATRAKDELFLVN